ncbi:histidine kinase [Pseudoduganella sp. DS3]|uniref:Histidine kinase n=1 Tax=Pseudoduganella guangdongensis TaxID=2692179 RepID=A0A6N9HGJ2_9BURK|nr:sensor histidine kinase [Pseudoduganella guangdongensis]MYN02664.1 histidine kinase [Pseudoduganella guangdongensis]
MKKTLLLPALALLASLAAAAPPPHLLADYTHTAWTRLQGAPSDVVKFAQTADGWLWISSPGGLARFDGVRFERVEALGGHRLQSASTMGLLATRDGGLWIGHRFGGITALVGGKVREFGSEQGLPPSGVWSLAEGPDGSIWACVGGGLAVLAPGAARFAVVTPDSGLPAGGARQVLFSRSGRQWVSVQGGVYWRDGTGPFRRAWPQLDLMALAEGPDGAIWATDGQRHGYRVLPQAPPGNPAPRPAVAANGIHFDRHGTMWLLKGDALERAAGGPGSDSSQQLRRENGISGPLPQTWFEDREGNIWVGTASGLDRLRRNRLRLLATPQPLDHPGLLADSDGQVLVANQAGGVQRFSSAGEPLQLEGRLMTAGYRAPDGALWFGNNTERWRQAPSGLLSWYPHPPEYAQHDVQAMTLDRDGRMWLSVARHGLFSADGRQWTKDGGVAGLPQGLAPTVATDARGRVWVGYLGSRIAMIDNGKARLFGEAEGVRIGNVLSLLVDGDRLWAGGEYGVAWFDGRAFHMLEAPLRGISGMARTAQGELWLHGSEGITRIAAPEVARLLAEAGQGAPGQPVRYERFDAQDGLLGGAEQFRPLPSLVQASDGRLWFATASDVASLDPARIARNTLAPPVQIRALRSGGVSYMPLPQVRLPKGSRDVEIGFTALSLSMPERMRFSYMLEGVDSGWRDVQGRREAFYTNLAPGQYRFRVLASNEDGIWNAEGATLQLEIPPTFTQTPWFIALLVLGGGALLAAAYALRVRRLTARLQDLQQERLAERARIARGLHDTLLQSVQSLIMFFDRQAARLAPDSEEKAKVEQTLELADQLMAEGRNYILDLRSDGGADALAQALRQYGAVLLHERFHASSSGQARAMPPQVQEEVLSIAREALFNAARHAHATRVDLLLDYGANFFLLEVRDNGCGLGTASSPGPGRLGHYGLVGMRERAAALGATCSISSPAEGGTVVRLQLAAQLAFIERRQASWLARARRWLPFASSK